MNVSHFFLFVAAWFIITGLYYRLPIPIEPMKAIGAVVIAEGLCAGEIVASGIVVGGVLFLAIGLVGGMAWLEGRIPRSVIRGVQAGLALLLLRTSLGYIVVDTLVAVLAIAVIVAFFIASQRTRIPDISALLVLIIGLAVGISAQGDAAVPPDAPPPPRPRPPDAVGLHRRHLGPRPPADTAHDSERHPRDVPPHLRPLPEEGRRPPRPALADDRGDEPRLDAARRVSDVPRRRGGSPRCTGSARGPAGANIVAGIFILIFAVAFAPPPEVLTLIPLGGIFGALLVFVALELGKHSIKTESYLVTAVIAVLTLAVGLTVAFIVGMVLAYAVERRKSAGTPGP